MDKQVQLVANPELGSFAVALQLLDSAITGLSFDSETKVLLIHGSNILTDQQVINEAVNHPFIDHDSIAAVNFAASNVILTSNKGSNVGAMPLPVLSQIVIALAQRLNIADQNGVIK